jgi:hypothetical protein
VIVEAIIKKDDGKREEKGRKRKKRKKKRMKSLAWIQYCHWDTSLLFMLKTRCQ